MRDAVLKRLAEGPAPFSVLHVAIGGDFRQLDRTLQAMKRRGEIVLLPRQRRVRAFAEWSLPNGDESSRLVNANQEGT